MTEPTNIKINKEQHMNIKHLVISGGGPSGFIAYGAAKHLAKAGFWSVKNLKSIYGCSIGAFLAVLFSLDYDWDWLDDYIMKRPWDKVFAPALSAHEAWTQKGVISEKIVMDVLAPLLTAKELTSDVTLAELFAYNHIEIHIFTSNINSPIIEKVDLSYKTHPHLTVVKALCMSMAYPLAFRPMYHEGNCYIDGGLLNNYPLKDCLEHQEGCVAEEILAFRNVYVNTDVDGKNELCTDETPLIDFIAHIIRKMYLTISTEERQPKVPYTVRCIIENMEGFQNWFIAYQNRGQVIEKGCTQGKLFLEYINNV